MIKFLSALTILVSLTAMPVQNTSFAADEPMNNADFSKTFFILPAGAFIWSHDTDLNHASPEMLEVNINHINAVMDKWNVRTNQKNVQVGLYLAALVMGCSPWPGWADFCAGVSKDEFDPRPITKELEVLLEYNRRYPNRPLKAVFHINSGNYNYSELINDLFSSGELAQQDQFGRPSTDHPDWSSKGHKYLTMSKYATQVRFYRERNARAAVHHILDTLAENSGLKYLIGFDTSAEMGFSWNANAMTDYNPMILREFKDWMIQKFGDVDAINQKFGTSFKTVDEIDPPRYVPPTNPPVIPASVPRGAWDYLKEPSNPYWLLWRDFRYFILSQYTSWETSILRTELDQFLLEKSINGIDTKKRIWTHQFGFSYDIHGDNEFETARTDAGTIGLTIYGTWGNDYKNVQDYLKWFGNADPGYMLGEFNVMTNSYDDAFSTVESIYLNGGRVIAPITHDYVNVDEYPEPGSVGLNCLPDFDKYAFTTVLDCKGSNNWRSYYIRGTNFDLALKNLFAKYSGEETPRRRRIAHP